MSTHRTNQKKGPAPIRITVNGRRLIGQPDQTLAGVLLANGVTTLGRSIKYHRPRGYVCGFGMCGSCSMTVNGMPGTQACLTEVQNDDDVQLTRGYPTTRFDVARVADLLKPWLGAGFQFKLFPRNPRLSALAARMMARLAGGGVMPTDSAAEKARVQRTIDIETDVLVIGGGPSGLSAASQLAGHDDSIIVVDASFTGGRSSVRTEPTFANGHQIADAKDVCERLRAQLENRDNVQLITGKAAGILDGVVPVVGDKRIRYDIRPKRLVLANGSYEVPFLFANNDRPGVMFADAAVRLVEKDRISPGKRVIIATESTRGHDVAGRLARQGVNVTAVVDSRPLADVPASERTSTIGDSWAMVWGKSPVRVHGLSRVRRIRFTGSGPSTTLRADALVIAGSRRPADEFGLQLTYMAGGSHERAGSQGIHLPALWVGSAQGHYGYDLTEIRQQTQDWRNSQLDAPAIEHDDKESHDA